MIVMLNKFLWCKPSAKFPDGCKCRDCAIVYEVFIKSQWGEESKLPKKKRKQNDPLNIQYDWFVCEICEFDYCPLCENACDVHKTSFSSIPKKDVKKKSTKKRKKVAAPAQTADVTSPNVSVDNSKVKIVTCKQAVEFARGPRPAHLQKIYGTYSQCCTSTTTYLLTTNY